MANKKMTKTEFRKLCIQCGYASSKVVTEYIAQNPKDGYDDSDFMGAYRLEATFSGIKRVNKKG